MPRKRRPYQRKKTSPLHVRCRVCGRSIRHQSALGLWLPFEGAASFMCLKHVPARCRQCEQFFHSGDCEIRHRRSLGCYMVLDESRCLDCEAGLMANNGIVRSKELLLTG